MAEASTKMKLVSKKSDYDVLLKKLILQAVYQLMDSNILLKLRKDDVDTAKKFMPEIIKEYSIAFPNHDLKFEFDSNYLPSER